MARSSILADELVRQLVAVGQVDILVGVPTLNHAATVERIVRAVHVGLARHFPRERTVLINADGGSSDGTPDVVRRAPLADEERQGSGALRTTHRISAPILGLPDRAASVRTLFAAADLLQARVLVILDPELTSITPEWVAELTHAVWRDGFDFVLPIHPRRRFDGPLVSQLVRPLLGAAYARRLKANLGGVFACAGRVAASLLPHEIWERDPALPALDVWLAASALAGDFKVGQLHLGGWAVAARENRPRLPELFQQVVGTAFSCLEWHEPVWLARDGAIDLPEIGTPIPPTGPDPEFDPRPMADRYRDGLRDLQPLLREILDARTLAGLQTLAGSENGALRFPDPLWVSVVYEFAAAHRRGVMRGEHLTQALVPLYLGRVAALAGDLGALGESAAAERLDALARAYERSRPYLIERWSLGHREVSHG